MGAVSDATVGLLMISPFEAFGAAGFPIALPSAVILAPILSASAAFSYATKRANEYFFGKGNEKQERVISTYWAENTIGWSNVS